jgi:hypothetical protein
MISSVLLLCGGQPPWCGGLPPLCGGLPPLSTDVCCLPGRVTTTVARKGQIWLCFIRHVRTVEWHCELQFFIEGSAVFEQ